MACLKQHGNQAESCRSLAKHYLECRMERYTHCSSLCWTSPILHNCVLACKHVVHQS